MCTSIVVNQKKTLVGFNFDNPGLKYHVVTKNKAFYISLLVNGKLWEPCFGCNARGDFVNVPSMNPGVKESLYPGEGKAYHFLDRENLRLLLKQITFDELKALVQANPIYNEKDFSLQAQDSDKEGNVLQIFPGLGYKIFAKPAYSVLANFQLMRHEVTPHPWAGVDRYEKANALLAKANADFDVPDMFNVLKAVAQEDGGAPTAVSIVFDPASLMVYWCLNRKWDEIDQWNFDPEN
jgi:hypothetical protein